MPFLEIALRNAARGFKIHPLKDKEKAPRLFDWPGQATDDYATIEAWAAKWPNANVGVALGEDLCVLESDDWAQLSGKLTAHGYPSGMKTFTVEARQGRPHFYFYQTDKTRSIGNRDIGGLIEFKQNRRYVVGEGSTHPSGAAYQVIDPSPIIEMPDALTDAVIKLLAEHTRTNTGVNAGPVPIGGRHEHMTRIAGSMRRNGMGQDSILAALMAANDDPNVLSEPLHLDDLKHIAKSVSRYDVPEPEPTVVIGGRKAGEPKVPEAPPIVELDDIDELDEEITAAPLPPYPLEVWEGTIYHDFAVKASADNFIPPEFFIEGAMTYAGAVMGNQLACSADEITPRLYTVLIAPAGRGKGTTYRRLPRLFEPYRLLSSVDKDIPPKACSALLARAASENGLNDALLTHPQVISDFEEMDQLFEKMTISGSGGALMSVIRSLFDDTRPGLTTSKGRTQVAQLGYFSLLGSMTPSLWRRALEGKDSYGSGLGGRFNLVATHEIRTAAMLTQADFTEQRGALEKKFQDLDACPQYIGVDAAALQLLSEWWQGKNAPHYNRVNVIAGRKALHMTWVRGLPSVTKEIMADALKLADYLVNIREVFAVTKGEDRSALAENRVLQVLTSVAPKAVRAKQIVRMLDGQMGRASVYRALASLETSGEITKQTTTDKRGSYNVYIARVTE